MNKNKSYSQKSNFLSIDDSKVDIYGLSGPDSTLNNQQYPLVCQPIEQALSKQLEQEILLNQVTTKISQNFELPEILSTTVEQVQKLIKVDRFLIYQFNNPLSLTNNVTSENQRKGYVQYEALASENISSVLGLTEEENCFYLPHNSIARYSKVYVHAITDIEVVYGQFPCLVELMQQHQVKAKLVVPIIVDRQLWGLLIAHHCSIREWQDNEKRFIKKIAEHLAIAIYQAQLYGELQKQKQTLEKQVARRTQDLYDALQAAESANLTKSEFLATMSHELRTPLTCVIGISSTLLRWSYGNRGAKTIPIQKQRDYLQIIHDSGEHLLELINDILDLSQVEAGKAVLKIGNFFSLN
ncbi:histidine kinase dimerization/phospho-acceptor domain-containing protein [Okeania sp. KiyG1]|uniref:GAF domain-containing protein n=1 Tax=Okeania sp. KiyG1 TaxID=2720165 RepID=UPI0027DA6D80|nr:histidine kinase dimerization/phospho-acceptor domain-containing protein [Okeania sp. KiyG1]